MDEGSQHNYDVPSVACIIMLHVEPWFPLQTNCAVDGVDSYEEEDDGENQCLDVSFNCTIILEDVLRVWQWCEQILRK